MESGPSPYILILYMREGDTCDDCLEACTWCLYVNEGGAGVHERCWL